MLGLLGKKLGQTRVYDDQGALVCVTVVKAGPNHVVMRKTVESDGYNAVQLGFDEQKEHRVTKPLLGHFSKSKVPAVKWVKEFRNYKLDVKAGEKLSVTVFNKGDFVDAIGVTKGRGFQGVVKRHGFRGGDMTHGAKGWHRRSGAIGCRLFPGHVNRGLKMPGHMGQVQRTAQNLEVIQVRSEDHVILIKGSCPGSEGDYLIVRTAKKNPRKKQVTQASGAKKDDKKGASAAKKK